MSGLIEGINSLCEAGKLIAAALLVYCLIRTGIVSYLHGSDSKQQVKEDLYGYLKASAIIFGASYLAPEVISWFI